MRRLVLLLIVIAVIAGGYQYVGKQGRVLPAVAPWRNQISVGNNHVVAISASGYIFGWGANKDKELGLPGLLSTPIPKEISSDRRWRYVHTGTSASYAIASNGDLWRRAFDLATYAYSDGPVDKLKRHYVYESLNWDSMWSKVQERWGVVLGLDANGALWIWSDKDVRPEAERDIGGKAEPKLTPVPAPSEGWIDFCLGLRKFYAVASDGSLWESTVLPHNAIKSLPPEALQLTQMKAQANFRRVFCEVGTHMLALDAHHRLWGRGENEFGELGDGDGDPFTRNVPVRDLKRLNDKVWADVAVGHYFTVAIALDGSLWAWGNNTDGQLGTGNNDYRDIPTLVDKERVWVAVAAHTVTAVGLTQDGRIYAWGSNGLPDYGGPPRLGMLGDGGASRNRLVPTRIHGDTRWGLGPESNANY